MPGNIANAEISFVPIARVSLILEGALTTAHSPAVKLCLSEQLTYVGYMISRHHLSCGLLCLLKITFLEMIAVSTVKLFVCIELETKVFECGYDTYM